MPGLYRRSVVKSWCLFKPSEFHIFPLHEQTSVEHDQHKAAGGLAAAAHHAVADVSGLALCRAWQAEKQVMRDRRLAQEAARKQREEAAKAAAAAARAESHRKLMEDRKAKYVSEGHAGGGMGWARLCPQPITQFSNDMQASVTGWCYPDPVSSTSGTLRRQQRHDMLAGANHLWARG